MRFRVIDPRIARRSLLIEDLVTTRSSGPLPHTVAALCVASLCGLSHAYSQTVPSMPSGADAPTSTSLAEVDIVEAALRADPELAAIAARRDAALARAEAAGATWPQPRVSVQGWPLPIETRQGPQFLVASAHQAIPSLRRLDESDDPHLADAVALTHAFDARALRTIYGVEVAWIRLARVDAVSALVREQQRAIRDVADHEAAVLAFGGAEHIDLMRTSLLDVVLDDRLAQLADDRDEVVASLEAVTGLTRSALDGVRPELSDVVTRCNDVEVMIASSEAHHPAARVHEARSSAALERVDVARTSTREPVQASIAWGTIGRYDVALPGTGRGGRDTLMVGVSVPLPVLRRAADATERAHAATATAATEDAATVRQSLAGEIRAACARLDAAHDRIGRYERDLLPMADDIVAHYAIELSFDGAAHTEWLLAVEHALALRETVVEARAEAALAEASLRASGALPFETVEWTLAGRALDEGVTP